MSASIASTVTPTGRETWAASPSLSSPTSSPRGPWPTATTISASATVSSSVTPSGKRNIEELAALCEAIDREHGAGLDALSAPAGLAGDARLFVKSSCGFSRAALIARDNLHLQDALPVSNVSEDASARETLVKLAGKDQAPCLVAGDRVIQESADIIAHLVGAATDLPA